MYKRFRKQIAILMTLAIMVTPILMASAVSFSDTRGHWAENVITKWTDKGILYGYGDGKFYPDQSLTKAHYASILNQLLKYTEQAPNTYPELPGNAWYTPIFLKLIAAGVVEPGANGLINPNEPITRGEMMVWTVKAYKLVPLEGDTEFQDDSLIPEAQKPYVNALYENGMIAGYEVDGGFDVKAEQTLTRAEAVQVIDKIEEAFGTDGDPAVQSESNLQETWASPHKPGFSNNYYDYFNTSGSGLEVTTPPGLEITTPQALTPSALEE